MTDIMRDRLPTDLRQSARIMAELNTFETGQAIMNDAADEIERLRAVIEAAEDGLTAAYLAGHHDAKKEQ